MFKDLMELDHPVVERILDKMKEQNLAIEIETGIIRNGMVKVLFVYEDPVVLNRVVSEAINEEYDLCYL